MKKYFALGLLALLVQTTAALAAEKLTFATAVKVYSVYYLPVLAAEEGGFWKENDLAVEWVPFQGGGPMHQAIAAGSINIGIDMPSASFQAVARGIPVVFVSDLYTTDDFTVWVRGDSRLKEPQDLKGAKIGVARYGGAEHAYARAVVKALGIEKEAKHLAMGGIGQALAGLKTGSIDAVVMPPEIMIMLKVKAEARELLAVADYLPKEWVGSVIFSTKGMVKTKTDSVRRVVRAVLQATDFIRKNPAWAMEKMKSLSAYSDEAAKIIYAREAQRFTKDGKISKAGLENVKNFLIQYDIIPKEQAPSIDEVLVTEFTS